MLRIVLIGIVAAAVIAMVVGVGGVLWFDRSIRAEVESLVAHAADPHKVISETDLDGLPAPVRRYLVTSGVVGRPIPRLVTVTQTGRLRGSPDADWMAFEAEEVYSTQPPALLWRASFPSRTAPVVMGRDAWLDDRASIVMRMLGLVSVVDDRRELLVPAVMLRFLNEMIWFPQAYLLDGVSWQAIDDRSAEVTLTVGDRTVSGVAIFDHEDRQVNFRARRYNSDTDAMETWETPLTEWGTADGIAVPVAGYAVWQLDSGPFTYIEIETTGVSFD